MKMMKRIFLVALLALLVLPAAGCQSRPEDVLEVHDPRFKYLGTMVWLYQDGEGKIGMLQGNYQDVTAVMLPDHFSCLFSKAVSARGKGQLTHLTPVKHNQLIYLKNEVVPQDQLDSVVDEPDHVLAVNLEKLRPQLPEVRTEADLNVLKAEFESCMLVDRNPVVTITMADGGQVLIELFPEVAPQTVRNFVALARQGFYDGTIFHRIAPGWMIQGGDPQGTGFGGPGYSIRGEFALNGFPNQLSHTRGAISMARTYDPDSAGSQFFIVVEDQPGWDGQYAAFGQVISGMEVVDEIVNLPRDANDRPLEPPVMEKVTVEAYGVTYPEPEKLPG